VAEGSTVTLLEYGEYGPSYPGIGVSLEWLRFGNDSALPGWRLGFCKPTTRGDVVMKRKSGISNRQSSSEEAQERKEHPPLDPGSPPPEDAGGTVGERPLTDTRDRHTSHKAGSRSIAQKEDASKYADRSMPASRKVAGAFGKEPTSGASIDPEPETPKR
jgi:hypothetical protein